MPDLLKRLRSGQVLLMDGAMGTQLQALGLHMGACYEAWNLNHAEQVRGIHQAYVDAGAQCLLTNTFQAHARALARWGLEGQLSDILHAGAMHARSVAGPDRLVLADIGPQPELAELPGMVAAFGDLVDGFLLETFFDHKALAFAAALVAVARGKPVLLSLTYRRDPDTDTLTALDGTAPESFAEEAAQHGISALGVNCGWDMGLEHIAEVVRRYRSATTLPLLARPNAGTPQRAGTNWVYLLTPEQLAAWSLAVVQAGAVMVGGCCGTTPTHIAAIHQRLASVGTAITNN